MRRSLALALALALAATALTTGCDPVLNLFGSFFPAWTVCTFAGLVLAALARPLFVASGLEPYLPVAPAVYAGLALLFTFVTWLLLFRT